MLSQSRERKLFLCLLIGIFVWFIPTPEGLTNEAWHLFAVFLGTIALVVCEALPIGASTIIGLTIAAVTKTISFEQAFSGYANEVAWLVLLAFFVSQAIIKSGLGQRIAYMFAALLGNTILGLAYGICATELLLAPAIPSTTARSGGIVFPIVRSLADNLGSKPDKHSAHKVGTYLMAMAFQMSIISSAMFMTAMAGNPIVADLAKQLNVVLDFKTWAIAAIVPGLLSTIVMPLVLLKVCPPELTNTSHASFVARESLKNMGPMTRNEKLTLGTFIVLVTLWVLGAQIGIDAASAALIGLCLLLIFNVLNWKEIIHNASAWETFVWFGGLVALAKQLSLLGFTSWFGNLAASYMEGLPWIVALILLFLVYFYLHYLFASATAHISALFLPFTIIAINIGAPAMLVVLLFAFGSNLFGGLTHYGFGSAPIYFGSGYLTLREWWRVGFIVSLVNITVWVVSGSLWWKILQLY